MAHVGDFSPRFFPHISGRVPRVARESPAFSIGGPAVIKPFHWGDRVYLLHEETQRDKSIVPMDLFTVKEVLPLRFLFRATAHVRLSLIMPSAVPIAIGPSS